MMKRARRFLPWSREVLLERGFLALFACVMLFHLLRRAGAPKELEFIYYNDHFRHLRYAWESMTRGPGIYVMNTADLKPIGDGRAYGWPNITYFYPPGALLLYLPVSQLVFRDVVSFDTGADIMIFVFGMAAAFTGIRVWRQGARLTGTFEGSALWFVVAYCLFLMALSWGLRGQYDSVVIALLVAAGGCTSRTRRLLLLGLAFVLKFQALICLPFFAFDLLALMRERRLFKPIVLASVALTAMSLATAVFLGATGRLALAKQTPFNFASFPKDRVTVACTLFTVAFVLLASVRGRTGAAATALWVFAAFASLSVFQAWYILYFFGPIFLLERRSQPWFALWAVGFVYSLRWLPDTAYEISRLLAVSPG